MSGDETDGPHRKKRHLPLWAITRSLWQSKELVGCLHGLDKQYRHDWEHSRRFGRSRRSRGNPPRKRMFTKHSKVEEGTVPIGLWRNCYNQQWLETLLEDDVDALQIIDEDFDLTLPSVIPDSSEPESDSDSESDTDSDGGYEGKGKGKGKGEARADARVPMEGIQ